MKTYSRVYAKIDLDAILFNVEQMKKNIENKTEMVAVIKSDGYGHGAVPIATALEGVDGIWGYAVATLDEAAQLRINHIEKPILVLGCIFPDQYVMMLNDEIRMNVYEEEMARAISYLAQKLGKTAYIHIKLETGMARLGFEINEESVESIKRIQKLPNVCMEGIFTHFARADEEEKAFTYGQIEKYDWMVKRLKEEGVTFPYHHCANSAGIIDQNATDRELVRAGISLYGLYPSKEVRMENVPLQPALELKSHVAFVKKIEKGTPVSYGGTFVADREMKIATIPVGYGDGYPRSLSNKGYVLIKGQKAPIIGRVCMDQFMVDVSEIEDVRFGDEVVLVGESKGQYLPVETLSELSGRFPYEFVCNLGKRIPRVYVQNGKVTEQVDYFE